MAHGTAFTLDDLRAEFSHGLSVLRRSVSAPSAALLHGNGNIIAVAELPEPAELPLQQLSTAARTFCDLVAGTRIDGLAYLIARQGREPRMVFFDRDGTAEKMCGNGLRCLARYAYDASMIAATGVISTDDGGKDVRITPETTEGALGIPRELIRLDEKRWFLYTGVPHLVEIVDAADDIDVATEGARLRNDASLCRRVGHPEGIHVNFASWQQQLVVRTYEVGVEDETACCGTGVGAAAYIGWRTGRNSLPVNVATRGGPMRVDTRDGNLTIAGTVDYLVRPLGPASEPGFDGATS
ncbi:MULTISPECIES: diaminopimelate epimerase [unclassified Streptomyces]|uniref:diaminopimelate epimerase n=1 Tax=Streptomyces sp. NPDC127532 TaxID=3345399 RepID=UPI00363F1F01